jgi:hypothetical protein
MRLNSGEGNGPSLAGRTSQSTARIDRTAMNVVICRTFWRSIPIALSTASEPLPTAPISTDRVSTVKDLLGLQVFHLLNESRGRCGWYLDGLYGYISVMQANGACY